MSRAPGTGGRVCRSRGARSREEGSHIMTPRDLVVQDVFVLELISAAYEFVNTILPDVSPRNIASNPCLASVSGSVVLIAGRTPLSTQNLISRSSSSRVPIVDPITDNWRKKIRVSSAGGAS